MKISTLEWIHELLKEAEQKSKEDYNNARKLQHEYEESETADNDLVKAQQDAADELMRIHLEVINALNDFEDHEW